MAEAEGLTTGNADVLTLEENQLAAPEEPPVRLLHPAEKKQDEDGDPALRPLLPPESRCDTKTSAPRQDTGGSVRSLCGSIDSSSSGQRECPICGEAFTDPRGDHAASSLNCDHTLCQRCVSGIMARSRDPGSLRCPFCRQTTPLPQWEIRRLQEESYGGGGTQESQLHPMLLGSAFALDRPTLEAPPQNRNVRGCCEYPACLVRAGGLILLLFLLLLSCFLYVVVSVVRMSMPFNNG